VLSAFGCRARSLASRSSRAEQADRRLERNCCIPPGRAVASGRQLPGAGGRRWSCLVRGRRAVSASAAHWGRYRAQECGKGVEPPCPELVPFPEPTGTTTVGDKWLGDEMALALDDVHRLLRPIRDRVTMHVEVFRQASGASASRLATAGEQAPLATQSLGWPGSRSGNDLKRQERGDRRARTAPLEATAAIGTESSGASSWRVGRRSPPATAHDRLVGGRR